MLVSLQNICKSYGINPTVDVLKGIDLDIQKNDFIAITGRSGAGKSTILNIISGLDVATSGNYYFNDCVIDSTNNDKPAELRRHSIGMILQNFALLQTETVIDNIMLPCRYSNISKADAKTRAYELLDLLSLTDKSSRFPYELSGGESQRVAIARALITEPKLLLADEPTGSLDTETEASILSILQQINHRGVALVIVTHNAEVASRCTRQVELKNGKLIEMTDSYEKNF